MSQLIQPKSRNTLSKLHKKFPICFLIIFLSKLLRKQMINLTDIIPAVGIVQQILERNYNAVRIAALGVRIVIVIVDGDEANPFRARFPLVP